LDWRAKVELFEKIRREYFGTILGVAKKVGVHRRTVREAIRSAVPAKRKKIQRETTRLVSAVLLFIHQILMEDQQAPRKQRHTAQRIYERLRQEIPEQEVSPRSVRRAVQKWKQERQRERAETYISQQYEAGREAQVDWYVTTKAFCRFGVTPTASTAVRVGVTSLSCRAEHCPVGIQKKDFSLVP
jgi:uncharacterized protein (UPF0147 family)